MNIIDIGSVIGSDTLCTLSEPSKSGISKFFQYEDFMNIPVKVAEDIWQSTANNLVIPDGLICDVEFIINDIKDIETGCPSDDIDRLFTPVTITAIKVTGTQEGWRYACEGDKGA